MNDFLLFVRTFIGIAFLFEGRETYMNYIDETEDNPKMFQVYLKQAWHEVFCYALAFEKSKRSEDKLLIIILSGSDSALQSIRGAIDIGSRGGLHNG